MVPVASKASSHNIGDHADGVAEHFLADHPQVTCGLRRGRAAIDKELVAKAAVGPQMRGQDAAIVARRPRPTRASNTKAAAPSPNSTQVPRSSQSRMREKVSAPITSARLCEPETRNLSAVATANTKPEQTALHDRRRPRASCRGRPGSGSRPRGTCSPASMSRRSMRSMSAPLQARASRERRPRRVAGPAPRWSRRPPRYGAAWIPVRWTIHSSEVSSAPSRDRRLVRTSVSGR